MSRWRGALALGAALMLSAGLARGETRMIETFEGKPETRWEFFTDQVMGGVSTGRITIEKGAQPFLRLQGQVSTENNGGFIQARLKLSERLAEGAEGIELRVRGNGQAYYLHARTKGTVLPWNFYQAQFQAGGEWTTVRVPFAAFEKQGRLLRKGLRPEAVVSLAVVAYGRDHEADLSVAGIGVY